MRRVVALAAVVLPLPAALGLVAAGCGAVVSEAGASDAPGPDGGAPADGARRDDAALDVAATGEVVAPDARDATTIGPGLCRTNADCDDGKCIELVPGFAVCAYGAAPPQPCTDAGGGGPFADECCGSCGGGAICTLVTSCGGAFFAPHNACVADDCAGDADCGAGGVCAPRGVLGPGRRCLPQPSSCRSQADCGGGACVALGVVGPTSTCTPWSCGPGTASERPQTGLHCEAAPQCLRDADCAKGAHCERSGGQLVCLAGTRSPCPPPP